MSEQVKRWDHAVRWESMKISASYMAIRDGGKYVLSTDYDALQARLEAAEAEVARLFEEMGGLNRALDRFRSHSHGITALAEIERLREALRACVDHGAMTGADWVIDKANAALAGEGGE